ncbi:unnamed protein product [Polarella glacialis]|uniref:Uncharacterized protein n=1 Tax=Polarella glacialis TaxID=89957 RepID=A0A813JTY7_POLGL|nr:unnamed protein product [Polarella glacialis]
MDRADRQGVRAEHFFGKRGLGDVVDKLEEWNITGDDLDVKYNFTAQSDEPLKARFAMRMASMHCMRRMQLPKAIWWKQVLPCLELFTVSGDQMPDSETFCQVIQEIHHPEPAAVRDEEVAMLTVRNQVDEDFADLVERRVQEGEPIQRSAKVYMISFRSGKGELFRRMLLQDPEFKPLRKSLKDAGYPIVLQPSKTIVLVRPDQYLDTVNSPTLRSCTFKRYNAIIAASEEYLMDQVLMRMASKQRPREHRQERMELELDDWTFKFITKRTLICTAPQLLMASTVVQSTTEAARSSSGPSASASYFVHARGGNPRRRILDEHTWSVEAEDAI